MVSNYDKIVLFENIIIRTLIWMSECMSDQKKNIYLHSSCITKKQSDKKLMLIFPLSLCKIFSPSTTAINCAKNKHSCKSFFKAKLFSS